MVLVDYPPRKFPQLTKDLIASPEIYELSEKSSLIRLYRHKSGRTGITFKYDTKPSERFDHHVEDEVRGTHYSSFELSCCIAECFGSRRGSKPRSIDLNIYSRARLELQEDLLLVDLRGKKAMRLGTVAAISAIEDRDKTQSWSRAIYDNFGYAKGLIYSGAHTEQSCILLYERADCKIFQIDSCSLQEIREEILSIANDINFIILPKKDYSHYYEDISD